MEGSGTDRPGDDAGAYSDAIGLLGVFVAILGLNHLLWIRLWDLASGTRSLVLLGIAFAAFRVAGNCLAPEKDGEPAAPRSAATFGLFATWAFAGALLEAGRAWGLPQSPVGSLALAGVCLGTGQAVGSALLAGAGALVLYSTVSARLALELGLAGGMATDAIFVALAVAIALAAAGLHRTRRGARVAGLAMARIGSFLALAMLSLLSIHGNGYHGLGPDAWAGKAWTAVLVAACLGLVRVASRLGTPRLGRMASAFLCLRALYAYLDYGAALLPPFVAFLGAGVLLLGLSSALDRFAHREAARAGEEGEPAPPPAARDPERRRKTLALSLLLACLAVGGAHLKGLVDQLLPARAEARVRLVEAAVPPILIPVWDPSGIDSPGSAAPGDRLDVHMQAVGISGVAVVLGPAVATAPGAPPPPGLDPARTLLTEGRRISVRVFEGGRIEGVVPRLPLWIDVPIALWGGVPAESDLVLRIGRLGTIRPVRVESPAR